MFDLTNLTPIRDLLREQEIDSENECIVRRIISSDGRSKSSINGNPCTQQHCAISARYLLIFMDNTNIKHY